MDTAKSIDNLLAALKAGNGEAVLAVSKVEPEIKST